MFEGLLQPTHLLLILVIVLIVFGPGKLPDLGRALGQSIRELRESSNPAQSQATSVSPPPPVAPVAPTAPVSPPQGPGPRPD